MYRDCDVNTHTHINFFFKVSHLALCRHTSLTERLFMLGSKKEAVVIISVRKEDLDFLFKFHAN